VAGKGKEVAGQIGCGFRGLEDFFSIFAGFRRQVLLNKLPFTTTKDDGQKIVEVMGDTASEHPDSLNSLSRSIRRCASRSASSVFRRSVMSSTITSQDCGLPALCRNR
jgi:hypothetical protein